MEHKGTFMAEGQFRVLPRAVFVPRWQLYERKSRLAGQQASLLHSRRETTQINGVRDYVYGDRLTRIHWNATAKTGNWKSKEFEHESVPKTMIVLDGSAMVYAGSNQFELAVSIAASLLGFGIRDRIGIGLCCLDKNTKIFMPAEGAAERQKMIQYLIDINAEGRGPLVQAGQRTPYVSQRFLSGIDQSAERTACTGCDALGGEPGNDAFPYSCAQSCSGQPRRRMDGCAEIPRGNRL